MLSDILNAWPSSGRATVRGLIASLACAFVLLGGGGWIAPAAAQAPTVTSLTPNSGPAGGGTEVIIAGTNFTSTATVKFGNTAVNPVSVLFVGSGEIVVTSSPAGTGTVDVTVTTAGGTSATSVNDQFTYTALPTVTGVSPTTGSGAGGTSVTITGTNFTGATNVNFGGFAAASFTVNSATDHRDDLARNWHGGRHGDHGGRHQRHECERSVHLHARAADRHQPQREYRSDRWRHPSDHQRHVLLFGRDGEVWQYGGGSGFRHPLEYHPDPCER
jgi:hypothetical protein